MISKTLMKLKKQAKAIIKNSSLENMLKKR